MNWASLTTKLRSICLLCAFEQRRYEVLDVHVWIIVFRMSGLVWFECCSNVRQPKFQWGAMVKSSNDPDDLFLVTSSKFEGLYAHSVWIWLLRRWDF